MWSRIPNIVRDKLLGLGPFIEGLGLPIFIIMDQIWVKADSNLGTIVYNFSSD